MLELSVDGMGFSLEYVGFGIPPELDEDVA